MGPYPTHNRAVEKTGNDAGIDAMTKGGDAVVRVDQESGAGRGMMRMMGMTGTRGIGHTGLANLRDPLCEFWYNGRVSRGSFGPATRFAVLFGSHFLMPLTFPTLAEQALAAFMGKTKTLPVDHFVKQFGGTREPESNAARRVFVFEDDTTLVATGTGSALKLETHYP